MNAKTQFRMRELARKERTNLRNRATKQKQIERGYADRALRKLELELAK